MCCVTFTTENLTPNSFCSVRNNLDFFFLKKIRVIRCFETLNCDRRRNDVYTHLIQKSWSGNRPLVLIRANVRVKVDEVAKVDLRYTIESRRKVFSLPTKLTLKCVLLCTSVRNLKFHYLIRSRIIFLSSLSSCVYSRLSSELIHCLEFSFVCALKQKIKSK